MNSNNIVNTYETKADTQQLAEAIANNMPEIVRLY